MKEPIAYYHTQLEEKQAALSRVKKRLAASSTIRVLLFVSIVACVYVGYPNTQLIIGTAAIGIVLFLFLVTRHANLSHQKDKLQELININQLEIDVQSGELSKLTPGSRFIDPTHEYSLDIDLFGPKSFFQYLNRTVTLAGRKYLAQLLCANDIEHIAQKQQAVKELAKKVSWRQDFSAIARLVAVDVPVADIQNWFDKFKPFVSSAVAKLPKVFSVISLTLISLLFFEVIPFSILLYWFFLGLGITGVFIKKINSLYQDANQVQNTFEQYYKLVALIEKETFTSELLRAKQQQVIDQKEKASTVLKKFARILGAFDQRNNMLFGALANGLVLWDLWQSSRVEGWIASHNHKVRDWFEVIAFFDAYNSFGNFAFNHPTFRFPNITSGATTIAAVQLGHPLLHPEKRVDNDITIQNEQFFIITGANMAGKSTFLRTVGLQIVMSNVGLPVCATSCNYRPIKLVTSMRTSDSLSDDASYFFAELSQLKKIVDKLQEDEYFIILDEILKGTNSKDKASGSKKFVERLVGAKATGIIATHDLSLCETAKELPQVQNRYFDAQIIDDELFFDYTFKEGICQNMNASFLLKKMGII
ncbi:MutS-related protein [Aquimarina brevivitae]|uniref:MutS-like protein n=1 Tax=Aquimarina brevivitae TaxID=323412 RepID=A0A4Q7PGS4_9FLAO|nr:DNA mismatch repair protein MutS [Aquimarina brevivitae]RZS99724.1 MutS-like protein [Aquimarina brevivitae]